MHSLLRPAVLLPATTVHAAAGTCTACNTQYTWLRTTPSPSHDVIQPMRWGRGATFCWLSPSC
jgi:hypothetical protein